MTSVAYVVTTPLTYQRLMRGHLAHMRRAGFDVTAVSAPGPLLDEAGRREGVAVAPVPMAREITPLADVRSLARLVALFRRLRPQVVNAGTPKAGMLGMVAARLAGVPVRIYTLRGLRAETLRGPRGRLVSLTERLTSWCATEVIAVSPSLRQTYLDRGLARPSKVTVLGSGSSNGVDPARFHFDPADRHRIRAEAGIAPEAPVIGFVGRLVGDKGITDLIDALDRVRERAPGAALLVVGDYEDGDPVAAATRARIAADPGIHITGIVPDAARHYSAFDVLALPSLREGFPNAPLEAASAGVPTVGFDATGTRDAVVDGATGALVAIGDVDGLADRLADYLTDRDLRRRHGTEGRQRVVDEFHSERVWRLLEEHYRAALPATVIDLRPAGQPVHIDEGARVEAGG